MIDSGQRNSRYSGKDGRQKALSVLKQNLLVNEDDTLAQELYDCSEEVLFENGDTIIVQGASDDAVYFIISGTVEIRIKGKSRVVRREAPIQVGEMAALNASDTRSATVRAEGEVVTRRVSAAQFLKFCEAYPDFHTKALQDQNSRNKAWKLPRTEAPWFERFLSSKALIQLTGMLSVLIASFWIGKTYSLIAGVAVFSVLTLIILILPIWFNRTRLLYACFTTGCLSVLAYITAPLFFTSLDIGWLKGNISSQVSTEIGPLFLMGFVLLLLLGAAIFSQTRCGGARSLGNF